MNAIVFGGEKGGRNQKSTACSEGYIVRSLFSLFIVYDDSYDIILTVSWRQYQNKPQPSVTSPISSPKTISIHSFWSQNTEKRNTAISQMRLRSVFKMQISILNTATTEQMGYGSISFFVCFLLNELNSYYPECFLNTF